MKVHIDQDQVVLEEEWDIACEALVIGSIIGQGLTSAGISAGLSYYVITERWQKKP